MEQTILSRGQAWSIEDRAELGELAAAGMCAAAIAERLGRTPAAIRGEAWRQELRLAPDVGWWTQDERDQLRGLARTTTYSEAAETMGRTPAALRDQAGALNIFWRNTQCVGRQYTGLEDSKILAAAERRQPLGAVALELGGRTRKGVQGRLGRLRRRLRVDQREPILA